MTIHIIRDPNRPAIIFPDDIAEYGWQKAYILGNIGQCIKGDGSLPRKDEFYDFLCFKKIFLKKDFYEILDALIKSGLLIEGGENE